MSAGVWGPQTEDLQRLLLAVRSLTQEQMRGLADALDPSWFLAWDQACAAAKVDGLDEAVDATWYAAFAATDACAREAHLDSGASAKVTRAVGSATTALLARHLVRDDVDVSTEAYEQLTTPWRTVVGPLHPKDPPK